MSTRSRLPADRPIALAASVPTLRHLFRSASQANEADLGALAHSALALDLYAWLAQRLHRIDRHKPAFIPWTVLKEQFGPDYGRIRAFKEFFRSTLRTVVTRYQDARVELDDRGMTLRCSPPPVPWRYGIIRGAKAPPASG